MSTATLTEPRILSVDVTDEAIAAHLADGRIVSVPLEWSWRLSDATPQQRAHWEIIGEGQGVRWPDVDEDISVEGILRGVPAKRPSRTEMRILLDTSSLIDAEHGKPVSFSELNKTLREHHARLILTYTSVLEFAAPFEKTGDRLALREQLQQVERLPVGYLREGGIKLAELREAVKAFGEKRECVPINPYAKRWDETLVLEGSPPAEMLVNQSLYDLVSMALVRGSPIRHAEERWGEPLRNQFEDDRQLPTGTRWPMDKHFCETIRKHLAQHSIAFPPGLVKELADWIYNNPTTRCPGYRLAWEVRRELMSNIKEKVSGNDIFDIAHVRAVPYVDAITVDRNTADLCRRVIRRLKAKNPEINYEERIFTRLKELLDAKF
jgi:Protein of unknown function (DUF2442)